MITVRIPAGHTETADPLVDVLDDLVVAYRVVESDPAAVPVGLPAIEDGDRWIGAEELPEYLAELRGFVEEWRRFQSDACYLADDGSVC